MGSTMVATTVVIMVVMVDQHPRDGVRRHAHKFFGLAFGIETYA